MKPPVFCYRERIGLKNRALFAREDIACRHCERRSPHSHMVTIADLSAAEILAMDDASLVEALADYCEQERCSQDDAILALVREAREDRERGKDDLGRRVA